MTGPTPADNTLQDLMYTLDGLTMFNNVNCRTCQTQVSLQALRRNATACLLQQQVFCMMTCMHVLFSMKHAKVPKPAPK